MYRRSASVHCFEIRMGDSSLGKTHVSACGIVVFVFIVRFDVIDSYAGNDIIYTTVYSINNYKSKILSRGQRNHVIRKVE